MKSTALLLIDVQKDFHPGGSLAIPKSDEDAERITALIRTHGRHIDRIICTLDSHEALHIAHPSFWMKGGDGGNETLTHPVPFTIISAADIRNGVWKPRRDIIIPSSMMDPSIFENAQSVMDSNGKLDLLAYCIEYATRLESTGRLQLCVWPEHCLVGSSGHGLVDDVLQAVLEWSRQTGRSVEWVHKGQNLLTEMYSALAADIPVTKETNLNRSLLESLQQSTTVYVCGQAMSHCVNYTLRDIIHHWPNDRNRSDITLLTDCASAVPGFEAVANDFVRDMKEAGVQLKTTQDILTL